MNVTLSEVKRAARAHRAPLAGESAGYLVLALADQVLSAPRTIDASEIQLTDDGGLRVLSGQASSETDAELSLRRALDELLLVASSGSAALTRAGRRVSPIGLPALVRELEAALIPVNRAAARRALARLQRETARALASGLLPAEEAAAPVPFTTPDADESETRAIAVPVRENVDLPPALADFEGLDGASWDLTEETRDLSPVSDALTLALEVRAVVEQRAVPVLLLDEDVEFIDEEPSDALTVALGVEVAPISESPAAELTSVDLPEEACTRPEPFTLPRALRPLVWPSPHAPSAEPLPRTPTLGSLAAELPVLAPDLLAAMALREAEASIVPEVPSLELPELPSPEHESLAEPSPAPSEAELVVCSARSQEFTEPMPEVAPLLPGVAIVASRRSDVSELLAGFQVAEDTTHQGLRRAIKELAELDLTPAPFATLIR